jgi:hypothetical protein
MIKTRLLLTCLTLLAGATCGARAEEAADAAGATAFAKRLFAVKAIDHKTYACFVRRYDADHLKQHPLQKVSAMKLLLTVESVPDDPALQYSFRIGVNFRNRPGNFDSSGSCGRAEASTTKEGELEMSCSVDCDGGGVAVALADSDKSVILRLEQIRIWDAKKPDPDAGQSLQGGADDRVFRLDRVDAENCASLVADRKELAAMRHK